MGQVDGQSDIKIYGNIEIDRSHKEKGEQQKKLRDSQFLVWNANGLMQPFRKFNGNAERQE